MQKLLEYSSKLISGVKSDFYRYKYTQINWENRLIGLKGARGIGKTTLILQHIKNRLKISETLYVTAEDFYFSSNKLVDLADNFVKSGGKHLFIDEIHKYPDWSRELKLIYDYYPDLKVVFTGSAILNLNKGASDLSRRAVMYDMKGLSFREYLKLFHNINSDVFTIADILNHKIKIPDLAHPLPYFRSYLERGYYPFALDQDFSKRLEQIIVQTLESDIPQFAEMNVATGRKLKQLLAIIAKSVPFKPNFSKIGELLGASRNNIADYLIHMEEAGLISQLRNSTGGIRGLGKVEKVYLDNTNLIYLLEPDNMNIGNLRETFFYNQAKVMHNVISSSKGDFFMDGVTYEVGGKNKNQKQIINTPDSYIVRDDIEEGFNNIIPLWQLGMMY